MTLHEAAEQALESMENNLWAVMDQAPAIDVNAYHAAIVALRAALAEPDISETMDKVYREATAIRARGNDEPA